MAEIKVRGLPELRKALRELPMRLQQNAMRIAIQEAAKVFEAEVKVATPVWAGPLGPSAERPRGALRKSVKARRRRARQFQVRSTVDMLFYGRLLEKGWMLTGHKPRKVKIRRIGPHEFVLPAFQRARDRAIEAFADVVRREIVAQPLKARARLVKNVGKALAGALDDGGQ